MQFVPSQAYHYVNSGHEGQAYAGTGGGDKRVSWVPPAAHNTSGHSRRHSAVPVVSLQEYAVAPGQPHPDYVQPPAAHTTREQHLLAPAKGWGPPQAIHAGYR